MYLDICVAVYIYIWGGINVQTLEYSKWIFF